MHKCRQCGSTFSGKTCPACGEKRRNAFPAFLSYLFFLPHLTPANERERKRDLLDFLTRVLFLLFSIAFFIGLVIPAVEIKLWNGTDLSRAKSYSYSILSLMSKAAALKKSAGAMADELTGAYGVSITFLCLCLAAFLFSAFCLICKRKGYLRKGTLAFTLVRDALYLVMLATTVYYLFVEGGEALLFTALLDVQKTGNAGVPLSFFRAASPFLVGCTAATAGVTLIADLIRWRLLTIDEYKTTGKKRKKLMAHASDLDLFPPKAIGALHRALDILPYVLVCLFLAIAVILCFAPKNSFLNIHRALRYILRLIRDNPESSSVLSEYGYALGLIKRVCNTALADMILAYLLFGGSVCVLVFKLKMKREPRYFKMLPFLLYALALFLGLVTMLPIASVMGKRTFLLAGVMPPCLLFVLSIGLMLLKNAIANTFDFSLRGGLPHGYERQRGIYHLNFMRGVPVVAEYAFARCERLTSAVFSKDVRRVEMSAFETCTLLGRAVFNDGLLEIGDYAFLDCVNLAEVVLPASCVRIGEYAFANCLLLKTIRFQGTCAEWQAVEKGEHWDDGIGAYCVRCKDGEIVFKA